MRRLPSRRARSQMISESRARVARRIDRLLDMDHARLHVGGHALFFLLQAAGEHDIGMLRGLRKEEIDHAEELQLAPAPRA